MAVIALELPPLPVTGASYQADILRDPYNYQVVVAPVISPTSAAITYTEPKLIKGSLIAINYLGLSTAEANILKSESGYYDGQQWYLNTMARNPYSTAFGMWQCIQSTCQTIAAIHGFNPHTINPEEQLTMFRTYIRITPKYGTAERAWAWHLRYGYY